MKQGWEIKNFEDCIVKVRNTTKIPKKKFLNDGAYPIISQENEFINGYWDNEDDIFRVEKPLVIFGDHTKKVKYVDFNFVMGADGIKVLQPIDDINARFFFYQIQSLPIEDLGYARHFRLLKKQYISIPPLDEQKRIVVKLDECFEAIDKARANVEQNLNNAKELFQSRKNDLFKKLEEDLSKVPLPSVCDEIFAGGDAPKDNYSKEKTETFNIPIIANAVKDNGLYGYTNKIRVSKPSITIAARGSGTGHTEIRYEPFFPIVRLIVIIPNDGKVKLEFLKYSIQNFDIMRSGSAIPQLTVPMIKDYSLLLPSIPEQKQIVNQLDKLKSQTQSLESNYQQELDALDELKKSILQKAFNGEL